MKVTKKLLFIFSPQHLQCMVMLVLQKVFGEGLDRGGAEEQLCQTLQASPFDDGGFGDGGRGGTFE